MMPPIQTKGKTSSSTINDYYNLNRTVIDDDDEDYDMTMNRERKSNVIMNQRREN